MRRRAKVAVASALVTAATVTGAVALAGGSHAFHARLTGYQEDPAAISTNGNGRFQAQVDAKGQEIAWTLSYSDLEGGALQQAHIHLGRPSQSGGVIAFFCTNLGNGPAGTQACPPAPATISGTIKPADVVGPANQGIAAGEFAELLRAMRAGATYVNVHTATYPTGEIRAQLDGRHFGRFKG